MRSLACFAGASNLVHAAGWTTDPTACGNDPLSRLQITGLTGILTLAMDYMHCMHLGWLQYFYGSVLYVLAFSLLPEEPTANLLALGHMIKEHQKRHDAKHRYRMRLDKVTMIKPKKVFPSFVVEQQTFLEWHTACMICGCNSWMVATSSTNRFDFF